MAQAARKLALDPGRLGALAEISAQHPCDRGARARRRFEDAGMVRPGKTATVIATAREEFVVAAAGKGEGVGKRLVQILFEHVAPNEHAASAVDHLDPAGGVADRLVEPAPGEPVIR